MFYLIKTYGFLKNSCFLRMELCIVRPRSSADACHPLRPRGVQYGPFLCPSVRRCARRASIRAIRVCSSARRPFYRRPFRPLSLCLPVSLLRRFSVSPPPPRWAEPRRHSETHGQGTETHTRYFPTFVRGAFLLPFLFRCSFFPTTALRAWSSSSLCCVRAVCIRWLLAC